MSITTTGLNWLKYGGRSYGELVFGTGYDKLTNSVTAALKNRGANGQSYLGAVKNGVKDGFVSMHDYNVAQSAANGGFFKNMWYQLKTTPSVINAERKTAAQLAKAAGKNTFWAGTKGFFKGVGKKMPLIGGVIACLSEIPNIWGATKEQGLWAGAKETVKSGTRLGAGMAGGAIGAALLSPIPVVGSLVGGILGYMLGDKLASFVTGKSYSEKKMDEEEQLAQVQAQQEQLMQQYQQAQQAQQAQMTQVGGSFDTGTTNPFATYNPTQLAAMQQQLYGGGGMSDDYMYQMMMANRGRA